MEKPDQALTKVTSKRQVTLPISVCRDLNINAGDHLRVRVFEGSIYLEPVVVVDRSQAWFWAPEWQETEREATEDIKAGRVHEFDSADDAIAALDDFAQAER